MKKAVSALLALMLLLSAVSGCGNAGAPTWAAGEVRDGVYVNESAGLRFVLPQDWVQASEEETRSILNADPSDSSTIYDILAGTQDNRAMMYVLCLDPSKQIGGTKMTEDGFLQASADEIAADDTMASMHYSFSDFFTQTFGGMDYRCMDLYTNDVLTQRIMMHKLSASALVMVGITATSPELLDYYMAHFTDDAASIPPAPEPAAPELAAAFSRGSVEAGVYRSDYLGLSFTAPEGWNYASDEELAELMGISLDMFGEDIYGDSAELAKEFAQQAVIYDMAAASSDGSGSVQIVLENLSASIGGSQLTEAEYAEIVRQQFASITEFTYEFEEPYTQELAGKTFMVLEASVAEYGMQQLFYLLRVDKYMLCMTLTSAQGPAEALSECFSAA